MEPYEEFLDGIGERSAEPQLGVEMALAVEGCCERNAEPPACTARIPAERPFGRKMDLVILPFRYRPPDSAACKKCEAHVRIQGKGNGEELARLQEPDRISFFSSSFFGFPDPPGNAVRTGEPNTRA